MGREINLDELSVKELKALGYDLLMQAEELGKQIALVKQVIISKENNKREVADE